MTPCITLSLHRQWNTLIVCSPGAPPLVKSIINSPEARSDSMDIRNPPFKLDTSATPLV